MAWFRSLGPPTMSDLGTRLHYHCRLTVKAADGDASSWGLAVREVRKWVGGSLRRLLDFDRPPSDLQRQWFFRGGDWKPPRKRRLVVRTRSAAGLDESAGDLPWALRYEHPCSEYPFRQWGVDVGLGPSSTAGACTLVVTLSHWVMPGYIGEEPDGPEPTAPGIVTQFIRSKRWDARAGSALLTDRPHVLEPGQGDQLRDMLIDTDRACPIIYASMSAGSDKNALDCRALARKLAGAAVVCCATSPELDEELGWLLSSSHRCTGGMVRVYREQVDLKSDRDARRHRYFTAKRVAELTPGELSSQLVVGILRRYRRLSADQVGTVEDVALAGQSRRLAKLRETAKDSADSEYAKALEMQVSTVEQQLARRDVKIDELELKLEAAEDSYCEADDRAREGESDVRAAKAWAAEQTTRAEREAARASALDHLTKLPRTLRQVVDTLQKVHSGNIIFTDEALASADDSKFTDIAAAWDCLSSVATILPELCIERNLSGPQLVDAFEQGSGGFELALTETKATKKQSKLMALRQVSLDGDVFDITPHVKIGNRDPKLLRVHFDIDRKRKRIVVGHCGGHLTTAGSRRRR